MDNREEVIESSEYSAQRYRLLFERNLAGVFISRHDGQVLECNDAFARMMGYDSRSEVLDVSSHEFYFSPEDRDHYLSDLMKNGMLTNYEICHRRRDGDPVWVLANVHLVGEKDTGRPLIDGTIIDITERKTAEESLRTSLEEKEVLLREVHHRVKNNLQVISSILSLQSGQVTDDRVLDVLTESQNRIKSIAFIHENLYRSADISSIEFDQYLIGLVNNLLRSYRTNPELIHFKHDIDRIDIALDQAIPCGLMVNELISNSLKYAFPNGGRGTIELSLKQQEDGLLLVISDDGVGMPAHKDLSNSNSLGLQLVATLVEQMEGGMALSTENGTKFMIRFQPSLSS